MSTLNVPRKGYELHRAIVQSADPVTGVTQVKIPDLLGQSIVDVHPVGLERVSGAYQTPNVGDMSLVAVSNDGTQIMWVLSADHSAIWTDLSAAAVGGVLSVTGTPNQVTTSASVGHLTLSLPQDIHTAATPTFAEVKLSAAAGSFRSYKWQTSGSLRWQMYADNSTESGSNAGSNLVLARHSDTGTSLGTIFTVNRSTGVIALTGDVSFPNTTNVGLTNAAGTAYFHLDRSTGNSQWRTKSGATAFIDADTLTVRENAGTTNRLVVDSTTVTSPNTLTLTKATGPHINIAPTNTTGASEWITFGTISNALGAPNLSARSVGTRVILFDNFIASTAADYAIGMEGSNIWFGTPNSSTGFKWYAGTTNTMQLTGAGVLTVNGNTVWHEGNDGSGSGLNADLYRGALIQSGTTTATTNASGDVTVTFGTAFGATPNVITSAVSSAGTDLTVVLTARSASSFTVRFRTAGTADNAQSRTVAWVAIGTP